MVEVYDGRLECAIRALRRQTKDKLTDYRKRQYYRTPRERRNMKDRAAAKRRNWMYNREKHPDVL